MLVCEIMIHYLELYLFFFVPKIRLVLLIFCPGGILMFQNHPAIVPIVPIVWVSLRLPLTSTIQQVLSQNRYHHQHSTLISTC